MDDSNIFCPHCGREQSGYTQSSYYRERPIYGAEYDGRSYKWITVISFLVPAIALFTYFWFNYTSPGKARAAAKGGFWGISFSLPIVGLVLFLLFKNSSRDTAKGCGISAIVGVSLNVAISIVLYVLALTVGLPSEIVEFLGVI